MYIYKGLSPLFTPIKRTRFVSNTSLSRELLLIPGSLGVETEVEDKSYHHWTGGWTFVSPSPCACLANNSKAIHPFWELPMEEIKQAFRGAKWKNGNETIIQLKWTSLPIESNFYSLLFPQDPLRQQLNFIASIRKFYLFSKLILLH